MIRLFSADLDNTLLGNPEATRRFQAVWRRIPADRRPVLTYNSGRLIEDVRAMVRENPLPEPDYIFGGVGTEVWDARAGKRLDEFGETLKDGWDREKVDAIMERVPGIERQPDQFQTPFKSSWYLRRAEPAQIQAVREQLAEAGVQAQVIYSSLRDLDVLPGRANKGNALHWLADRLGIALEDTLVAGDTGNDSSMFLLPGVKGIVVENAQPELYEAVVRLPVYCATKILADGVLEGLVHFGVVEEAPRIDHRQTAGLSALDPALAMAVRTDRRPLTDDDWKLIETGYQRAMDTLRRNVTPLGFSACSLLDNEVTGTDENYRSVWARDGALTIVTTVEVSDPDIREAQRCTLRTLLDHMSPPGQIPANVRIDDGTPDYSGVGGICAIDSGLWVIIAFYNYVRVTNDHDLLREYGPRLQRAMDWLSAHDTNNDGLLEIPEAGDWTDLFGRSYHVLYDEVLWFRANVCYSRLLEFQGHYDRAADYMRWSQQIRGRILSLFWPKTRPAAGEVGGGFADRQFSIGDAQYLLSEITPFGFNWRCDVLGNLMAFLMNLIDVERARTAFRFMWGVGVNEPGPVANLYPVVQAGDPDWKPYYIVNLLNLPHHYHNGGIWPFIGGMWVRYIHRLGLHWLACQELLRLARLNQLGVRSEWEFNEWLHGVTGRPMGKAHQAWSAASYIRACQEIQATEPHGKEAAE